MSTSRYWKYWQKLRSHESAAPPNMLANPDLSLDTKVKRCEKTSVFFNKIYTWAPASNVFWLMREIRMFCREIKDAQRAHNNISLTNNAKASRSKANGISQDDICVFIHFLLALKQHTTEAQFQDLVNRLAP